MKIKGPGGPTPPQNDTVDKVSSQGNRRTAFAEQMDPALKADELAKSVAPAATEKPGGLQGPGSPAATSGPDSIGKLAAALENGTLTPPEAVERLLEMVTQEGAAKGLPPEVQAGLKANLESMLQDDPFLANKLRKLGGGLGDES